MFDRDEALHLFEYDRCGGTTVPEHFFTTWPAERRCQSISSLLGRRRAAPSSEEMLWHRIPYHRGQIAQLVRAAGHAPLDLDYIIWMRLRAEAASATRRGS